ncbi:hypothetical protein IWX49DRAFT_366914 [Phyllosticta citricarpa]|uniref:Uncharacterized protein n=2 Tax=Phyllosticta TaxID=121621 RepID=A0ABR1MJ66_9PEZI
MNIMGNADDAAIQIYSIPSIPLTNLSPQLCTVHTPRTAAAAAAAGIIAYNSHVTHHTISHQSLPSRTTENNKNELAANSARRGTPANPPSHKEGSRARLRQRARNFLTGMRTTTRNLLGKRKKVLARSFAFQETTVAPMTLRLHHCFFLVRLCTVHRHFVFISCSSSLLVIITLLTMMPPPLILRWLEGGRQLPPCWLPALPPGWMAGWLANWLARCCCCCRRLLKQYGL